MLPCSVPRCTGMGAVLPAGSATMVVAPVYIACTTANASHGKPRLCMMASMSSWSMVLKAAVKSIMSMYRSLLNALASSHAMVRTSTTWVVLLNLRPPACPSHMMPCSSA